MPGLTVMFSKVVDPDILTNRLSFQQDGVPHIFVLMSEYFHDAGYDNVVLTLAYLKDKVYQNQNKKANYANNLKSKNSGIK